LPGGFGFFAQVSGMAASETTNSKADLKKTPLHALHLELGAKMVPFAGYDMPVTYPPGLIKEHLHTREAAGLFDVSHMGQCYVVSDNWETTARALEALVPAEVLTLKPGRQRYSQLTNDEGGLLDDLMITRLPYEDFAGAAYLVVNAGAKHADYAHIAARLPAGVRLEVEPDLALIALQGPKAAEVLAAIVPEVAEMPFMTCRGAVWNGVGVHISRSGYTGEDGYEISLKGEAGPEFAKALLANPLVMPVGLGARDTLRLESGLCLSGHDFDATVSPVEAGLTFSIGKRRREEGGFPGAARIQAELRNGPSRLRVGFKLEGRAPAREGCEIADRSGAVIGSVTSGSFTPTVGAPIAMGYVPPALSAPGTALDILIRGKPNPATVVPMPFVEQRYYRKTKSGT
jgi:aminomethyltransferase